MTMTCNFCGASITSTKVGEVLAWDVSHKTECPARLEGQSA